MDARALDRTETLADGEVVRIRFLGPEDKDGLVGLFGRLSPETIYRRFLGPRKSWTKKDLEYLTDLDGRRRVALAAILVREGEEVMVGLASYMMAPGERVGRPELGIVVEDAQQSRGIGTLLLRHLLGVASAQGIAELEALILAENDQIIAPLVLLGIEVERVIEDGVTSVTFRTDDALHRLCGEEVRAKTKSRALTL